MDVEGKQWEIGSEFHWQGIPKGPFIQWPEPYSMFATGRDTLLAIWRICQDKHVKALFVPDYFCDEVVSWWIRKGINIQRYSDDPHMAEPIWETLSITTDDAVLAVNYFGVRNGEIWEKWREANSNKGVILIEDHTHDPLSAWAFNSKADFAFASLRKTFPAPDGAILWSPQGMTLPKEYPCDNHSASLLKLTAMLLKKDYLETGDKQIKDIFRAFQIDGEELFGNAKPSAISPWSNILLSSGYPIEWRDQRKKNILLFLALIDGHPLIKPIFTDWPEGHCPLNAIVLFPNPEDREEYQFKLIKKNIFPSVHWKLPLNTRHGASDIANRIMTIPIDQRYNEEVVRRVVSILFSEQE